MVLTLKKGWEGGYCPHNRNWFRDRETSRRCLRRFERTGIVPKAANTSDSDNDAPSRFGRVVIALTIASGLWTS